MFEVYYITDFSLFCKLLDRLSKNDIIIIFKTGLKQQNKQQKKQNNTDGRFHLPVTHKQQDW